MNNKLQKLLANYVTKIAQTKETVLNKIADQTFDIEDAGGNIYVYKSYDHKFILLGIKDTTVRLTTREATQLAKALSEEALSIMNERLGGEGKYPMEPRSEQVEEPEDNNDAKFHSLEHTKEIEKKHPGKWIVYVNGDTNPSLEFKTEHEAKEAAKNEWEASLLGDVKVSVCWSADDDDPRFGEVSFTPFYELGWIDHFGRWKTAWDKISSHQPKTISELMKQQDRPTVPASESEDEKKLYEELLSALEPEKAPKFPGEEEAEKLKRSGK